MLTSHIIRVVVETALAEDASYGDITCETTIPMDGTGSAHLTMRENGVMNGINMLAATSVAQNPAVTATVTVKGGERFRRGRIFVIMEGPMRDLLTAERIALNFTQYMGGIVTMAAAFMGTVNAVYGDDYDGPITRPRHYERVRIVDTHRATPGLRPFEKYAVVYGGGHNHHYGLSGTVMMKDNHLAALAACGIDLVGAIRHVREQVGHTTHIGMEVDRPDQIPVMLAGGAGTITLDDSSPNDTHRGVRLIDGKVIAETSGDMSLERVPAMVAAGVGAISMGAPTHSMCSIGLGLDWN